VAGGEILAVRLSSLGDLLLAFPALAAIRTQHPGAHLRVLTKADYVSLLAAHPAVDEALTVVPGRGLRPLLATARELRARGFTGAYDLHGQARTRALIALAGIPVLGRVRTRPFARRALVIRGHARRLLARPAPPGASRGSNLPLAALAMAQAVVPGITAADLPRVTLRLPDSAPWAAPLAGRVRVALCPGARHVTKAWPGFPALARALAARGDSVAVVLGKGDRWHGPPIAGVVRIEGSLLDLAAALKHADLAVGNDSGLTHLAAAAGTPAVVLFGATVPALGFVPLGPHALVEREELGCRPCSVHGGPHCPRGDFACLVGIGPERVLSVVDALLNDRRPGLAHVR
jgi:ADP-heptose:LPS heptosyltransferase